LPSKLGDENKAEVELRHSTKLLYVRCASRPYLGWGGQQEVPIGGYSRSSDDYGRSSFNRYSVKLCDLELQIQVIQ
jgi:hypothetical protein